MSLRKKGHGFDPAKKDPVKFHSPPAFKRDENNEIVPVDQETVVSYTDIVSDSIYTQMKNNELVTVLTAAMCAGNKLGKVRDEFPDRFFDTGICESHAVAFAAGMAKSGLRPIIDIYSTFLQRSFDHIFQEVALQNLPVVFCLDRAGLCGPDGPTHHGVFDITYLRMFPNMVLMAPGDEKDVPLMLEFALNHNGPISIRYPKTSTFEIDRAPSAIELGKSEILDWGEDGTFLAFGTEVKECLEASRILREEGLEVGVINARFAKPLDVETIIRAVKETGFLITVEENALQGGFGSAVLEAVNQAGLSTEKILTLGIPDHFIEHGPRNELLADLGLDTQGLVDSARKMALKTSFDQVQN